MTDVAMQERREQLIAELADHTMYELIGGEAALRTIVDHFYDVMDGDPRFVTIRVMHADDLGEMRVGLFEFLSGWLGGPPLFGQRTGSVCLTHAHMPFAIGPEARDLWLQCMGRAMNLAAVPLRYQEAVFPALFNIAESLRNTDD
jgi:hemoglobin